MKTLRLTALATLPVVLALSACGSSEDEAVEAVDGSDPALTGALADQIMVDPDLAGQNKSGQAMQANGAPKSEVPAENASPEAIAKARAEALRAVGGKMEQAPAAKAGGSADPLHATPDELAAGAGGAAAGCADKVDYSAAWATKLPNGIEIYPRGHVIESAGTDKDGCALRVVNYVTPVPPQDVIDFYYTRTRASGYDAEHTSEGKDSVLGGSKGQNAYVVYVRKLDSGMTEVDLVASGK